MTEGERRKGVLEVLGLRFPFNSYFPLNRAVGALAVWTLFAIF